jgi:tripartite-type tricarboxylate transporter receptor subunit TctC
LNDIVPIALIERGPLALMVRIDSPYKSVQDLVAAAKAAPGKLSYASGGIGGTHHLSGALFEHAAGIDMIHAPYKSGAAGATDLMGGQVNLMFEQMYSAMPALRGGRFRALAVTSKTRSALLPDVPTMAELGYPAVEVMNWQGLVGPKGLSPELVRLLNSVCNKALQDPEVKDKIISQGNEVGGGTPEQFAALIRAESPRWAKVVRDAKIEPE